MEIDGSSNVGAGQSASKLHLVRAFNKSKTMFEKNEFAAAKTREDFVTKLDEAIGNSGKSVRLDI